MTEPKHINHFGISGGKDSTALLLWAVYESGYPKDSIVATFCDVGDQMEAPETYAQIQMLSERVHPIQTLKPDLDFWELAEKKKRFPTAKARFCTQFLKMIPTQRFIHSLLEQGHTIIAHSGVRADESPSRAKLPEREFDPGLLCEVFRPLLHWHIEDVWAIHDRYGIPVNPLYKMGAKRVGCFPCVMSRKDEIQMIARTHPERIDFIREKEDQVNTVSSSGATFFHSKTVPARFRTHQGQTANGHPIKIATIDDVVRWASGAKFAKNENQGEFDFCPSSIGMCE